jgi:hypothetical protein
MVPWVMNGNLSTRNRDGGLNLRLKRREFLEIYSPEGTVQSL